MVTHYDVQRQLKAAGANIKWWGRAEIRELEHVLVPGENIKFCINGRYEGGFAMLCITDQRILLVDKKPLYLTLEDLRYDMISEVDFNQRLIDSSIIVCTVNKTLRFMALKSVTLRKATAYVQGRVMEFRHQPLSNFQTQPVQQQPQQQLDQPFIAQLQAPSIYPEPISGPLAESTNPVKALEHRIINPYTRVPLMMRRRVSRFSS